MFKLKLFALSFLLATGTFLVIIYANYRKQINSAAPTLVRVADNVFITSQLTPDGVYSLKDHGIVTVVDIRPDGEEPGQTSSAGIKFRSMQLGLRFHYIPVPHESIRMVPCPS